MEKGGEIKFTLPFDLGEDLVFEDKILIPYKGDFIVLYLSEFDADVSYEDFLKIDYSNILGELITFPVMMNRIGLLRATYEEIVKTKKFEAQIYESKLKNYYRKKFLASGEKKPTVDEIETAVRTDQGYGIIMSNLFKAEKGFAMIESMYWATKDKSGKLDRIADKISPKEFEKEILEGSVNGIMIKFKKSKLP